MTAIAETPLVRMDAWVRRAPGLTDGSIADVGLVVPTFRRGADVVALLGCLVALPDRPSEVVIVDGSPDEEAEHCVDRWAADRDVPFDLVFVRSAPGLTRQRNVGIDTCTRELVFFLDDDCRPEPGYFRDIAAVFDADTEKRVGAVSGSIVNEMDLPLSARWRVRLLLGIVPRTLSPGAYHPSATSVPRSLMAPFYGVRRVDMVPGGAAAYRRDVFAGDRFSRFFEGYSQGEDLEMSLRLRRRWMLLWSGDAHVLHHHAPGGRPSSVAKGAMEVRNRYFILRRHSPNARVLDRLRFWADIAYIAGYDIVSAVLRPGSASHLRHALGVLKGAASCFVAPPRYDEPPARREYQVVLRDRVRATPSESERLPVAT